jgi:hypothetical protein
MSKLARLSAVALIASLPMGSIAGDEPFVGSFEGTGRACYGKLVVKAKTLSWQTPFSHCKPQAYESIKRDESGKDFRIAFKLKKPSEACLYSVIELHRFESGSPKPTYLWNATGYRSQTDYQSHSSDTLDCPVVPVESGASKGRNFP